MTAGGIYKVAVVELEEGFDGVPSMISLRAQGVKRIVDIWRKLNVGKTGRCAYQVALAEANEIADRLNSLVKHD